MTVLQWDYPDPFVMTVTVETCHIDALAHTRNTHYVEWCMDAAWGHTTHLGLGAEEYQQLDRAMALTHAEYDYLKATREGDELLIGTWITDWPGRMKMTRRLQIVCKKTGATVFRGTLEFVCIEISTGAPKRPPKAFVDIYSPAIAAATSRDPGAP
jgi:acyl-CoA thioester hydrolase